VGRSTPPHPATQAPDITAQISTASLGQHLRRHLDQFPRDRVAYLKADATRAARYRAQVRADGKTQLVGVSWISKNPERGIHKTCALDAMAPLWQAWSSNTTFVDLQYGDTAQERAAFGRPLMHIGDLDLFHDIDGLAALISTCDRVVTVSNTTAHLAGALGVPVDVIVPAGTGRLWYWGIDQAKSPWYPSATLYKQTAPNRWDDTITRIARQRETP
jgi:ADP-heptose:LPS heptosyltransferase